MSEQANPKTNPLTPLCPRFAAALVHAPSASSKTTDKARTCLLDFLACVYSTQQFPWVANARQVAIQNSTMTEGGAPILGSASRVSVQDAAFVNAIAGHSLVRDDMHVGSVSHLGVVVIPAALALAEQEQVSGKVLVEAIINGYEAGGKLGALLMDVETAKKIRPTGLIGAFAAAATGAKLLSLSENQTANALGLASNYITGLNEWADWGSEDMYFHPGIAVRNGITAVQLAINGAVAAAGSLDGKAGLFAALGKAVPEAPVLPFADGEEINKVFFKQVPACNYAQSAAQVALQARTENPLSLADTKNIVIKVPHAAAHYPGCDYAGPFNSILQARMSIHFNVASALLHGDFEDSHYQDFSNTDTLALAKKVSVLVDEDLTAAYPAKQGASIEIRDSSNSVALHLEDTIAASQEEIRSRFLSAATPLLGKEKTKTLLKLVRNLESLPVLDDLLASLTN